eukprot:493653-Rhodomonas_salina.2
MPNTAGGGLRGPELGGLAVGSSVRSMVPAGGCWAGSTRSALVIRRVLEAAGDVEAAAWRSSCTSHRTRARGLSPPRDPRSEPRRRLA